MLDLGKATMVIFKRTSMTIGLLLTTVMVFADAKTHKIAFYVGESDPKGMNMALNNA